MVKQKWITIIIHFKKKTITKKRDAPSRRGRPTVPRSSLRVDRLYHGRVLPRGNTSNDGSGPAASQLTDRGITFS